MKIEKPNFRIFLADDDHEDRALFFEALSDLPLKCDVFHFSDGIHLMAQLVIDTAILPNLIFLDINMPLMDGAACLKKIRNTENLINIPVVIYTAAFNANEITLLKEMGASRYLQKPNSYNQLKTLLYRCIKPFYGYPDNLAIKGNSFVVEI